MHKELTATYKVRLDELEEQLQTERTSFEKKKDALKKKLAEVEWLKDEYELEIKMLREKLASTGE